MNKQDKQALDILIEVEKHSSRNDKELILSQNKDNKRLQEILEYTYNPYKVYGIGSKGFAKKYIDSHDETVESIIDVLEYLLANNTGTDYDKVVVNTYINEQPESYRDLLKKIVLKDLKVGITEKTVNKVWQNLIPTFDVMLAFPFERLPENVAIELKLDGVRATAIKKDGKAALFTRNGKQIEGFNDIVSQIESLSIDNIVLDGELISDNNYKKTMEKVFKKSKNKVADYMIFDILPLSEFEKGKSKLKYEARRVQLENLVPNLNKTKNLKIMQVVQIISNPTVEQINMLAIEVEKNGFEGVMVKDMNAEYICKRDYGWQKAKSFKDGDFEIIRIEEGNGKNKGKMGRVVIDVNGVEVGLGSGWSDQERVDMWNNPNEYIGKIVEVQYQELIEATGSLRFPTVKGIRNDK